MDTQCGGTRPKNAMKTGLPLPNCISSSALGFHATTITSAPSMGPPFTPPDHAGIVATWDSSMPFGGPRFRLTCGNVAGVIKLV